MLIYNTKYKYILWFIFKFAKEKLCVYNFNKHWNRYLFFYMFI